jgi:hypothetical protein
LAAGYEKNDVGIEIPAEITKPGLIVGLAEEIVFGDNDVRKTF